MVASPPLKSSEAEGFAELREYAYAIPATPTAVAAELAKGAVVLVAGDPGNAWGIALPR